MPARTYSVYILTNTTHTVFYIGVTNNLTRRMFEHKQGKIKGFTQKYKVNKLVYQESFSSVLDALRAEKRLKSWKRVWKLDLIRKTNPAFSDLALGLDVNRVQGDNSMTIIRHPGLDP